MSFDSYMLNIFLVYIFTAKVMSDYIQVFWNPPKDQSIKVKGYKLGWGKGVPDVEVRLLDGKERSFTIDQLGE